MLKIAILRSIVVFFTFFVLLCTTLTAQEAKFQQAADGLVSMEAENYSGMRESSGNSEWMMMEDPAEFSGTGGMQAMPEGFNDHKDITNAQANAPVMEYSVNFISTQQLYVWGRSSHVDGYDDSVWFGFDGLIEGTQPLSYTTDEQPFANEWYWISHFMDGTRAVLNVPTTGVHVFEIYMREPSYKIDKIVLTPDENYNPGTENPMGPAETLFDTAVETQNSPHGFKLLQNYPNPFNPNTVIEFTVPYRTHVQIDIYNTVGHKIKTLVSEMKDAGSHTVSWNAVGENGTAVAAGIYYYSIQADNFYQVQKMLYIK